VRKWSLDELREVALNPQAGDARRGELVFRDALCVRCHRFGRNGAAVGPDLTFVGGRFSRHDILDSILNPSKAVAENYRSVTVQTTDGQVVTGRLVAGGDFRSERIRLVPDSLRPDQVVELDKQSIEDHWPSDASPMPQGLLDTWARDDIADLLAYLTGRTK
jgi:putative heme-binding domain-containing protein